ncbi:MAG: hypothetical protein V1813_03605 [Candidatus Aenigmatarchaeota archaeon]
MLKKGQLDIDIEFMGGTIIFVALGCLLYLMIIAPLLAVQYATSEAGSNVGSMEYSNYMKRSLLDARGDGSMMSRAGLSLAVSSGQHPAGAGAGYVAVTDMLGLAEWVFDGEKDKTSSHETFAVMSTDVFPAPEGSFSVMQKGKDYVVHAYKAGGTLMLDIHYDVICGSVSREDPSAFTAPRCEDVKPLRAVALDAKGVSSSCVVPVKNGKQERTLTLVTASSDVEASDLVPAGLDLLLASDCVPGKDGGMCVRLVGRQALPLRIYAAYKGGAFS